MRSIVSPEFRKALSRLPPDIQDLAVRAYETWKANPEHPSLHFRRLKPHSVYSVRVGLHYRAVCSEVENGLFVWDWIGSHADYDILVRSLG